jgi:hypothetical protein
MTNELLEERVCRCPECVQPETATSLEPLRVYGEACANCGHFSPLRSDCTEGCCLRFCIHPGPERRMYLYLRRVEGLRENEFPLVVGGAFVCGDFRPFHNPPALDRPLAKLWDNPKKP